MLNGRRVAVVLPAYNAATTLARTVEEIDRSVVDDVLVVDDASTDATAEVSRSLGLEPIVHDKNGGYGSNQKTCYKTAIARGGEVIVMLHPDYQYSPRLVVPLAGMICYGDYDMALGSRILAQNTVKGGMPRYKYVSNRALTAFENVVVGNKLSEYHTGLRAYSKELLEALPLDRNSDDFVFDNQLIVQAMAAGARIGELSCPTRYFDEASSIGFGASVRYGLGVLRTAAQYRRSRHATSKHEYLSLVRPLNTEEAGVGSEHSSTFS
jgi:glycosyltransferase involved in cell wall biosynthesis